MIADSPEFDAWFPEPDGFPRPDWKAIGDFIKTHADADHVQSAWQEISRTWLQKTSARLDGNYTVTESSAFHLLSELQGGSQQQLLSYLEQSRARVLHTLAGIPLPQWLGKHVVMRFTLEDDYYRYVSFFDPEGDWASTSGRFIAAGGYMHIAYYHHDQIGMDLGVLAHELTHNLLSGFPIPLWLNEALAMLFEKDLAGAQQPVLNRQLAARHRAYWNARTIQDFWSGKSFSEPNAQAVSYSLAGILLDFIITDIAPAPPEFRDFVVHADWKDAGTAAARDYLGIELNDLVSAFLGPGEWAPAMSVIRSDAGTALS